MGLKRKTKIRLRKGGALNKGIKRKTQQSQRIIPMLLFSLLVALGAVGGGATSIVKAFNDAKANRQRLEYQKHHDIGMEKSAKGKVLYLRPYKRYWLHLKPRKKPSN